MVGGIFLMEFLVDFRMLAVFTRKDNNLAGLLVLALISEMALKRLLRWLTLCRLFCGVFVDFRMLAPNASHLTSANNRLVDWPALASTSKLVEVNATSYMHYV